MSRKEVLRAGLLKAALVGKISNAQGALAMRVSVRQFQPTKVRFVAEGARGLLHRLRSRPAARRLPAPTLLSRVFGCTNPSSDYASGQDLFRGWSWEWLIAASRRSFALVEPDRVTIVSSTSYEIRDGNYRLVRNAALPRDRLRTAQAEMRRFYGP
jgi:hypothetical protein